MPRTIASTRTATGGRNVTQPFYMNILNASAQSVGITKIVANDLSGLSAGTLVVRCRITAVVNGAAIFQAGTDGTQNVMTIKNQNSINQKFRVNFRAGGAATNNDIAGFTYELNKFYTIALRYTGSAYEFWVDGVKIQSNAASGAFGTVTGNWSIGSHNIDVLFARAWTSSLSDPNLAAAMANNYTAGAAINVDFIEGKGLPIDKANAAACTVSNAPTWAQLYTRSMGSSFGLDFSFNSSSYVTFGTGSIVNQNSPVSISLWLLRRTTGSQERIAGRAISGAWDLEITSGNLINFNFFGVTSHTSITAITDTTTWHHIVCTYDATLGSNQIKIYIDGVLDRQVTESGTLTSTAAEFRVSDVSNFAHVFVDDIRLFNVALNQTNVTHLFNRDGFQPPGLILWAQLDEGQGTTTADSSGNGITGTLRNSVSTSAGNLPLWVPSPLFVAQTRTVVS